MPHPQALLETVKQSASERWPEILSSLGGCPIELLDGRHHPCPKCGGRDRFRLIDAACGAVFCNQCFSERNGDGLAALGWLRGWAFKDTLKSLAEYLNVSLKPVAGAKVTKTPAAPRGKSKAVFVTFPAAIKEILRENLPKDLSLGRPKLARVDRYDTFAVVRVDVPTPPGEKQRKTFRPIHQVKLQDGRSALKFGYPDGQRPLFRRAEMAAAADKSLLLVCGGEKAAEAAATLGFPATTCAGGEEAAKNSDWQPAGEFAKAIVLIDNDPAGHKYGQAVTRALADVNPSMPVNVLLLPNLPPKGDVVEWIAAGGTREKLLELIENLEGKTGIVGSTLDNKKPDGEDTRPERLPVERDRAICSALGMDVLGELPDRSIKIFSETHGKCILLESINKLSLADLLQICGPNVRSKVHEGREPIPGVYQLSQVRESVAVLAGCERAGDDVELGTGVWLGHRRPDAKRSDPLPVILVGGGDAVTYQSPASVHKLRHPRAAGVKLNLASGAAWYDFERLSGYLNQTQDNTFVHETIDRATALFANWEWRQGDVVPNLVVGLLMASWVQTIWEWRPLVSIVGPSDCGKSTLFDVLETMFGKLALKCSKPSEAGLRQAIRHRAVIVLVDEFEHGRERKKILELFRTSSRGAKTLRGTSNQAGMTFGLQHIPWMAAVEIGMDREPDRNRFIALELGHLLRERRGKLALPPEPEIADLGQRLLAIAVANANSARRLCRTLRSHRTDGIHGRVIESFAVPVSVLAATMGLDAEKSHLLMDRILGGMTHDVAQAITDEQALLDVILGSTIDLPRGEKLSVAQLIERRKENEEYADALERVGIGFYFNRRGRRCEGFATPDVLFVDPQSVKRYLLRGTSWEDQSVDQILSRIDGTVKERRRLSGKQGRGVSIPWQYIENLLGKQEGDQEELEF